MTALGKPLKTYQPNMKTFYILMGVAVICCFIGVICVWSGINRFHAPPGILDEMSLGGASRKNSLTNRIVIATINVIMSIGCVAAAMFQKSVRLEIHEKGLVSRRGRLRESIRWNAIQSVQEHKFDSVTHGPDVRRRSIRYFVTIHTDDGNEILLRGIEDVRDAGVQIAQHCELELQRVTV
ncbi:MAG: DUF6585 family protein [Fuerstiella sp.]